MDTLTAYMEESISFISDLQPGFHISQAPFPGKIPIENTVSSDKQKWQIEKFTLLD